MDPFLNLLAIVTPDNNINYVKFVELLNWKLYFPEIVRNCRTGSLDKKYYYETTYNAAINDYKIIDNSSK